MARICIIEDDEVFSRALKKLMTPQHEVQLYVQIPAVEELAEQQPDIVFLDFMFPGARDFLSSMRDDKRTSAISVILMTAHHEMMTEANELMSDSEEFLKKPMTARQVMATVQRHLGRTKQQE